MAAPLFTVLTPTFNRAHTLDRVYHSLCAQTLADFEWIIVDDGSTDETENIVRNWQHQNLIVIRYFQQENLGKHIAFNHGVREGKGQFFLTLDSDDECKPFTLERLRSHWLAIVAAIRHRYSPVTCLCEGTKGNIVGSGYPADPLDCSMQASIYKYVVERSL